MKRACWPVSVPENRSAPVENAGKLHRVSTRPPYNTRPQLRSPSFGGCLKRCCTRSPAHTPLQCEYAHVYSPAPAASALWTRWPLSGFGELRPYSHSRLIGRRRTDVHSFVTSGFRSCQAATAQRRPLLAHCCPHLPGCSPCGRQTKVLMLNLRVLAWLSVEWKMCCLVPGTR